MIYLDNAATTKACERSLDAAIRLYGEEYFNPSAVYKPAISVKRHLDTARVRVAEALSVTPSNIYFTSGGTESNNFAIKGICKNKSIGTIACGACEHPSVFNAFMDLKNLGFDVEFIHCQPNGRIDEEYFFDLIKRKPLSFLSIMHVNNETGAINDIEKLAKAAKAINPNCIIHSDGVQAFMKIPVNLQGTLIDLYSISAHKINGVKGVGALYIKNANSIKPLLFGGGQEKNMRSGTENTGGILAFSSAIDFWHDNREDFVANFIQFQKIVRTSLSDTQGVIYNSDEQDSSPHILSLNILNIKGEILLHMLEEKEIYIGKGSACSSKETTSRALKALNVKGEGTIRISFGAFNTLSEVELFSRELVFTINNLRRMMKK